VKLLNGKRLSGLGLIGENETVVVMGDMEWQMANSEM